MQKRKHRTGKRSQQDRAATFAGGPTAMEAIEEGNTGPVPIDFDHQLDADGADMEIHSSVLDPEKIKSERNLAERYFAGMNKSWSMGINRFLIESKGRTEGVAPDLLGEVGATIISVLKKAVPTISEGTGLDEKSLAYAAGEKLGKTRVRGVGDVESGEERFETTADRAKGQLTYSLELGLGDAVAATNYISGKLEEIHNTTAAKFRSETIDDLVAKLASVGNDLLVAWERYLNVASDRAIDDLYLQTDGFKLTMYAADVYAMCERALFEAMSKNIGKTGSMSVAEIVNYRANLPGFIAAGIKAGGAAAESGHEKMPFASPDQVARSR